MIRATAVSCVLNSEIVHSVPRLRHPLGLELNPRQLSWLFAEGDE
jgi:hypothetical protein